MNEKQINELQAKMIMIIGTNHEHLPFKDVFDVAQTVTDVMVEATEDARELLK